jgi:hypothetical protein
MAERRPSSKGGYEETSGGVTNENKYKASRLDFWR